MEGGKLSCFGVKHRWSPINAMATCLGAEVGFVNELVATECARVLAEDAHDGIREDVSLAPLLGRANPVVDRSLAGGQWETASAATTNNNNNNNIPPHTNYNLSMSVAGQMLLAATPVPMYSCTKIIPVSRTDHTSSPFVFA